MLPEQRKQLALVSTAAPRNTVTATEVPACVCLLVPAYMTRGGWHGQLACPWSSANPLFPGSACQRTAEEAPPLDPPNAAQVPRLACPAVPDCNRSLVPLCSTLFRVVPRCSTFVPCLFHFRWPCGKPLRALMLRRRTNPFEHPKTTTYVRSMEQTFFYPATLRIFDPFPPDSPTA
jgi:hypothetical protein